MTQEEKKKFKVCKNCDFYWPCEKRCVGHNGWPNVARKHTCNKWIHSGIKI